MGRRLGQLPGVQQLVGEEALAELLGDRAYRGRSRQRGTALIEATLRAPAGTPR